MKKPKRPEVYVWDMLHEIHFIEQHAGKGWREDRLTSYAMLRCFTILGEAAKHVDEATKNGSSYIPWQKIVDTRNFISHDYEDVNLEKIDEIIRSYLPDLKKDLLTLYRTLTGTDYAD